MTLDILQKQMITAMKDHNKIRKETISSLIGAVKKAAIDKMCKDNITEELVNEVLLKEKKITQEMIDTCPADRVELLEEYKTRMAIIDEFRSTVNHLIATVDGIEYGNKGSVMKAIMPRLKGKADGKLINQIVTEICSKMK